MVGLTVAKPSLPIIFAGQKGSRMVEIHTDRPLRRYSPSACDRKIMSPVVRQVRHSFRCLHRHVFAPASLAPGPNGRPAPARWPEVWLSERERFVVDVGVADAEFVQGAADGCSHAGRAAQVDVRFSEVAKQAAQGCG